MDIADIAITWVECTVSTRARAGWAALSLNSRFNCLGEFFTVADEPDADGRWVVIGSSR